MSIKNKILIARKLISRLELKSGISIFNSRGWNLRKHEKEVSVAYQVAKKRLHRKPTSSKAMPIKGVRGV